MRNFRQILAASAAAALALGLSACSSNADKADSTNGADASGVVTLKVGASPSPHAKILKYVDENLAAEAGIDLDIVEYTDYIQPNEALKSGDLDANFFQTVPYLEQQAEENGYEFTAGKGIHLEPLAVYSEKLKSLDQLPEGATIGIIDDVTNQSRALALLAEQGLVTLPTDGSDANVHTVTKVKKFEFKEVQGPQLVRSLADVDVAIINGNFAQEGGLSPKDAIVVESPENNPAVNILAWANNTKKLDAVKKLEDLLHSDQVKQYIEQTWDDGSVIPAF
ncbi:MetQ/NlpA family ABC transporter substrate-binding protein [Schaalia cardiffensis]|uniref:MetQ/NlpA family ABC transporter substrate-binding protein n=1 Tax=Schaalia cardiffensis TaxID=181487 RepID=UPI0018E88139|nr:MetQ/NlpA family ABC transporter substrate-binding protein [Schaalia cardiffensis]MBJ2328738.1 MetQ/NlpA family ABC transporter substrate-binding protein [Schaalia cardiffensis]